MRIFILILLILFIDVQVISCQSKYYKRWSYNCLKWHDFKIVKKFSENKSLKEDEEIGALISTSTYGFIRQRNSVLLIKIIAVITRKIPVIRECYGDPIVLNHEQRHFDITEIFVRKLKSNIAERYNLIEKKKIRIEVSNIEKIIKETESEIKVFQNLYDQETLNGRDIEKQKIWEHKIDSMLASLEQYKKSTIKIPIKKK